MKNSKILLGIIMACLYLFTCCENEPKIDTYEPSDTEKALEEIGNYAKDHIEIEFAQFDSGEFEDAQASGRTLGISNQNPDIGISFGEDDLNENSLQELNQLIIKHTGSSIYSIVPDLEQQFSRVEGCTIRWRYYFFSNGGYTASVFKTCEGVIVGTTHYYYTPKLYVPLSPISSKNPIIPSFIRVFG
ncbi:MAG: hypothetical protein ABJF11_05480 [Reichenbachiella sp.]|uniref:hypothetical protein n=1 Tax=Reichenbachiella sp. TaxID=2184521 RepID=UPI0032666080